MILIPRRISRTFIQSHRELLFVYSSTVSNNIYHGHGYVCLGEPNVVNIPTKYRNCMSDGSAYFQDNHFFDITKHLIDNAIERIRKAQNGREVIIFPKIGKGCAELQVKAPQTLAYIERELAKMKSMNYTIDWNNIAK